MNNYQIYDEVGKGRFSSVYKGRRKKTIEYYAISSIDKSRRQRVLTNVRFLRSAHHQRIIKFHNWYETNNHLWVITELCTGGDMRQVINLDSRLSEAAVRMFGIDIAEGLMYTHSRGVVYGDLKPSNILMDSTMTMRFYDFGLSCDFNNVRAEGNVGTPLYMAPELFTKEGVPSMATDLWALGCLLFELATGKPPFDGADLSSLITNIMTEPFTRHEALSDELNALLEILLVKNPLQRATWGEVVSHDFWQGRLQLPTTAFPPQPAFESTKEKAFGASTSSASGDRGNAFMSKEEVEKHVGWAVENAKRNYIIAQSASEGGGSSKGPMVTEEVDLRDHSAVGDAAAAADGGGGVSSGTAGQGDAQRTSTGSPSGGSGAVAMNATQSQFHRKKERRQSETTTTTAEAAARAESGKNNNNGTGNRSGSMTTTTRKSSNHHNQNISHSVEVVTLKDGLENLNLDELMAHTSDAHIRPLVMNSRIERFIEQKYDPSALGFEPPTKSELKRLNEQQQSDFIRMIYRALSSSSCGYEEKLNILCYFETVCADVSTANFIVNSSIMMLCLKTASQRKAPSNVRATAISIMSILVRHATFIHEDLAKANILSSIIEVYNEEDSPRVKRKLAACLGELLIYIAVQRERDRGVWGINPTAVLNIYLSILIDPDDVLKHYAVKTIENLASVSDQGVAFGIFTKAEVLTALLSIYALPPSATCSEHMRSSAACGALKLAVLKENLIPVVLRSTYLKVEMYGDVLSATTAPKTAQALLTFINMAIVKSLVTLQNPIIQRWGRERTNMFSNSRLSREQANMVLETITKVVEAIVNGLTEGVDNATVAMKGKMLLFIILLGCMNEQLLLRFSSSKVVGCIDSVVRDKDLYVQRCAVSLASCLDAFLEAQLTALAKEISSGTTTSIILNAMCNFLSARNLGLMIKLSDGVFGSLGVCLEKTMSSSRYAMYGEEFNRLVGFLTQSGERILKHRYAVVNKLFPSYILMLSGSNVERHFSALRTLNAFVIPLVDTSGLSQDEKNMESEKLDHLMRTVAAALPGLLKENEPIPIFALRLLAACGERGSKAFTDIATVELTGHLVRYMLRSKHSDLSVPLHLLLLLAQQAERITDIMNYLASQEFFTAVLLKTLTMAVSDQLDHLLEPCCELSAFFLKHSMNNTNSQMTHQCLLLLPHHGMETLWLPLCNSPVRSAAENAAMCIYCFVRLSSTAQQGLMTTEAMNHMQQIISDTRGNPTTVFYILRALRYSCERSRKRDVQKLSECLLAALEAIAREGDCNKELSVEAVGIIELIRS